MEQENPTTDIIRVTAADPGVVIRPLTPALFNLLRVRLSRVRGLGHEIFINPPDVARKSIEAARILLDRGNEVTVGMELQYARAISNLDEFIAGRMDPEETARWAESVERAISRPWCTASDTIRLSRAINRLGRHLDGHPIGRYHIIATTELDAMTTGIESRDNRLAELLEETNKLHQQLRDMKDTRKTARRGTK